MAPSGSRYTLKELSALPRDSLAVFGRPLCEWKGNDSELSKRITTVLNIVYPFDSRRRASQQQLATKQLLRPAKFEMTAKFEQCLRAAFSTTFSWFISMRILDSFKSWLYANVQPSCARQKSTVLSYSANDTSETKFRTMLICRLIPRLPSKTKLQTTLPYNKRQS